MTARKTHYLTEQEMADLNVLLAQAQAKQQEASLAQFAVSIYVRLMVTQRGLSLKDDYQVSPQGKLIKVEKVDAPPS